MAKVRCGYCGKYYDEEYEGHLDNGSSCCPKCEEDGELHRAESEKERVKEKDKK